METKRQISWYRSQILAGLREWQEEGTNVEQLRQYARGYEEIAIQIRTSLDLPALRTLWERHKSLHSELTSQMAVENADQETTRKPLAKPPPIRSETLFSGHPTRGRVARTDFQVRQCRLHYI